MLITLRLMKAKVVLPSSKVYNLTLPRDHLVYIILHCFIAKQITIHLCTHTHTHHKFHVNKVNRNIKEKRYSLLDFCIYAENQFI